MEVRLEGEPEPLDQFVWDVRYVDAPAVRFHDSDTDGYLDTEGGILYYTTDANWNVTALVDEETGEVVERYMYDPYGKATVCDEAWTPREGNASAVANDVLYCGYRFDPETGLYQVRRRPYQPALGSWMQRDPHSYVDGMSLYAYARTSPTMRRDPSGALSSYQQCSKDQEATLKAAEEVAHQKIAQVRSAIADVVAALDPNTVLSSKLARAFSVLGCADRALKTLGSKCECPGESRLCNNADAWCNWVVATRIHICPTFCGIGQNLLSQAATLVHEATHKCGTGDGPLGGVYFNYNVPNAIQDAFPAGWDNIADTYAYWVYNGFYVPGIRS